MHDTENALGHAAQHQFFQPAATMRAHDDQVSIYAGQYAADALVHLVHAGTSLDAAGGLVASGGRVLGVVAQASDLAAARRDAYAAVDELDAPTLFHRGDIALKAGRGEIPTPAL